MLDFTNIDYLEKGSAMQRRIYDVLSRHQIMGRLSAFDAVLAGTFPIDIAVEGSDLDVLCYWENQEVFAAVLQSEFGMEYGFVMGNLLIDAQPTVIARFIIDEFDFEIFGQNVPVVEQNAFRHLQIEYAVLQKRGEASKDEIIKLKQSGMKTEPAFAQLLGLSGDPYRALLNYELEDNA